MGEWALAAAADNLFVNLGYQQIAKFLAGLVDAPRPTHLAVGTAANPVIAAADTALGTELSRKALASGGVIANYTVRLAAFWLAAEAQGTLTEVGLFSAASGGFLFARSAVTCVKGNQPMNVVWQFQLPTAG